MKQAGATGERLVVSNQTAILFRRNRGIWPRIYLQYHPERSKGSRSLVVRGQVALEVAAEAGGISFPWGVGRVGAKRRIETS